jgi:hypothetical protein
MSNDDTNTIVGLPEDQLKPTASHSEKVDRAQEDAEQAQIRSDEDLSPEEEKALLRRIDIKILPLVTGKEFDEALSQLGLSSSLSLF